MKINIQWLDGDFESAVTLDLDRAGEDIDIDLRKLPRGPGHFQFDAMSSGQVPDRTN